MTLSSILLPRSNYSVVCMPTKREKWCRQLSSHQYDFDYCHVEVSGDRQSSRVIFLITAGQIIFVAHRAACTCLSACDCIVTSSCVTLCCRCALAIHFEVNWSVLNELALLVALYLLWNFLSCRCSWTSDTNTWLPGVLSCFCQCTRKYTSGKVVFYWVAYEIQAFLPPEGPMFIGFGKLHIPCFIFSLCETGDWLFHLFFW